MQITKRYNKNKRYDIFQTHDAKCEYCGFVKIGIKVFDEDIRIRRVSNMSCESCGKKSYKRNPQENERLRKKEIINRSISLKKEYGIKLSNFIKRYTLADIKLFVSENFKDTMEVNRENTLVTYRSAIMYLIKDNHLIFKDITLKEISSVFNLVNHTTVISACNRVDKWLKGNTISYNRELKIFYTVKKIFDNHFYNLNQKL